MSESTLPLGEVTSPQTIEQWQQLVTQVAPLLDQLLVVQNGTAGLPIDQSDLEADIAKILEDSGDLLNAAAPIISAWINEQRPHIEVGKLTQKHSHCGDSRATSLRLRNRGCH